jgi:hypothetical protein
MLLGFLLLSTAMSFTSIESFMAQGTLQRIRWVRFLEGLLIVVFSFVGARTFGQDGVLAATLLASLLSLAMLLGRLGQSLPRIGWLTAVLIFKSVMILGAAATFSLLGGSFFQPLSLGTAVFWAGLAITTYIWIIPRDLQQEFAAALSAFWRNRKP